MKQNMLQIMDWRIPNNIFIKAGSTSFSMSVVEKKL